MSIFDRFWNSSKKAVPAQRTAPVSAPTAVDKLGGFTVERRSRPRKESPHGVKVFMLKGEGSVMDGFDVKGAYYYSQYDAPLFDQPWINGPKSSVDDHAFKIDVALSSLAPGLSLNYQYFDIGAGYFSNAASRRETDVLLTEGSESSWYGWGKSSTSIWLGGAAKMTTLPSSR